MVRFKTEVCPIGVVQITPAMNRTSLSKNLLYLQQLITNQGFEHGKIRKNTSHAICRLKKIQSD